MLYFAGLGGCGSFEKQMDISVDGIHVTGYFERREFSGMQRWQRRNSAGDFVFDPDSKSIVFSVGR